MRSYRKVDLIYCGTCYVDRRVGTQTHERVGDTETWKCRGCGTIKVKHGGQMISDAVIANQIASELAYEARV